jgi:hypothetical protein
MHGIEDQVISHTEGESIAQGLRAALAGANSPSSPRLDILTREFGLGHGMQAQCPAALLGVVSGIIMQLSEDGITAHGAVAVNQ